MDKTHHATQPQDDAATLVDRLAWILGAMKALVAARFIRQPHLVDLTVLLWRRLGRALLRFEQAMISPPAPPNAPLARKPGAARSRGVALPSGKGWLLGELGWEVAATLSDAGDGGAVGATGPRPRLSR